MKVLKPIYYDRFECIADKCEDSCCTGWGISVDKKSYTKYRKIKGEFGVVLNNGIKRNRKNNNLKNYGMMNLTEEKKCTFLNKDNLCNIYINLGPKYLCNTCKLYPRSLVKCGDMIERNLLLSCPEVTRMLVSTNDKFSFVIENEKLSQLDFDNIQEIKVDSLYNLFWKARSFFIELAQFREIELWKRISLIKFSQDKFQELIKNGDYSKIDNVIENLSKNIINQDFIRSLDSITIVSEVKSLFINSVIRLRRTFGINSNEFLNILSDFEKFLYENKGDQFKAIKEMEFNFDVYFKDKEYILENFLVYNLYKNCFEGITNKDLNEPIVKSIVEFTLLKNLLAVKWNERRELFDEEDIIKVMYSFCRTIEHNEKYMKLLCNNIKEAGYDSLAYLTILIR